MLSSIILALLAALLGAAFCFAGYRLFLVMLPVWGFFSGFWVGAWGVSALLGSGFLGTATGFVVGFVTGVAGAVLSYLVYRVGVGIIAAGFGGALASAIITGLGFETGLVSGLVILASALLAAGVTLLANLQQYVIMALTAMAGATLAVFASLILLGDVTVADLQARANFIEPVFQGSWLWGVLWLVLIGTGLLVQLRANRAYVFTREMYVEGWG